jgi:LPXTG-motif cell wall-anchored protein
MRQILLLAAVVAALIVSPTFVSAHAKVVSSTPENGATVDQAPSMITIKFDDELNSEGAKLTVTAASGATVDKGDGGVDLSDTEHKTMAVSLKSGLGAGAYTISWSVLGDDGHEVAGTLAFTVAGATAPAPAAPATSDAAAPTDASLPATGGASLPLAWLALGALVAAAGWLLRRRSLNIALKRG